jgi:hypothetical protein
MQKPFIIFIRVFEAGHRAKACSPADERLIEFFPKCGRPHKGFIIKSGGEKRVEFVVDRQRIKRERRPAVLAPGLQPVKQFCYSCPRIGFLPCATAQFNQRVGFF